MRTCALLVNPAAGRGRAAAVAQATDAVIGRLGRAGIRCQVLSGRSAEESAQLAESAANSDIDALVVVGGDGTVHLGLQALARFGPGAPALGVIATGTGNDLARQLGLPRRSPGEGADIIVNGHRRTIDLGYADGTWFVNVLSAGFDAHVNTRANAMAWPRGKIRYQLATLAELGALKTTAYTLEVDGQHLEMEAILVSVANGSTFGGGLQVCPEAIIDDGYLDVVVIGPLTRGGLVRAFPRLMTGTIANHSAFSTHRARTVAISATGVTAYADGEPVRSLPLTVEVRAAAVEVLAPQR